MCQFRYYSSPMLDIDDFASCTMYSTVLARSKRPRVYSDLSPEDRIRTMSIGQQTSYFKGYQNISTLLSIITLMQRTYGTITKEDIHDYYNCGDLYSHETQTEDCGTPTMIQCYAYLKQHKQHANEITIMMLDRYSLNHTADPLPDVQCCSQQVDRIEDRVTMYGVQVQLVMGEHRTESGMLIQETDIQEKIKKKAKSKQIQARSGKGKAAGYGGAQNKVGNANPGQARQVKCYNYNGIGHIARNCTQPKHPQNSEYFKDKMLLMQAQEKGVDLALNVDNVFQVDECDAFDFDVDEAPTAQTMFMANLSSTDPIYDEAGLSYDSDILSEVHDHDHYQDVVCEHHEEHEMHDDDNAMIVVQSNVSSVLNDTYMMIFNDMHEPYAQSVSDTTRNIVFDNSLTVELVTYKEQVELYERRARFELTEREQKIDEQLRIFITDRNIKEENLKKKLHSVKMQLASTINHNKSMVEEVTSLKKDFKQKENKYLEEFLDMKALKEKVEDKLYKQDQSLQIVHMLCKPKPYYNEQNKIAIGYKNPLCLTHAKQVQPALYNGYEIIKNNHVLALVHNIEDTLEIAEITWRKMNDKMKDPECVTHKVKIAPPDYSKENYLATFTPQKQLTR
ncbi:retrovirus-related pol polyprotein from transposon TNT 1-94 [Tanacetum coccineum]